MPDPPLGLSPAAAFIMGNYEVRVTDTHVILTCRRCHTQLRYPVTYHITTVFVYATTHLDDVHRANAPHP